MNFPLRASFPRFLFSSFLLVLTTLSQAEDQLIIVSPHWEGIQYEFGRAFKAYYQKTYKKPVRVRWRDLGGTSQIEKAIDASFAATPESCGVDIFFGGGLDPYQSQKDKGHLQAYQPPRKILKSIPAQVGGFPLIDPDHTYYGAALSSFGILENRRVLKFTGLPQVHEWSDLGQPELRSWISSADPRKSGSVHMIYEIILQAYGWNRGWQIIYRMSGNVRSFLHSSSAPTREVSAGDVAYAIAIDINGMTQQAFLGRDNVRFFIPEGASVINPDAIAILKGAPNLPQARAFLDFVMSKQGQSLWMKPRGSPEGAVKFGITRMGVIPSMYQGDRSKLLVPLNPFTRNDPFVYSSQTGSMRWGVINDLMGQSVIDVHRHLKSAWNALCDLPPEQRLPLLEGFDRPLISEAQASEYAAFWQNDKMKARRISNDWMSQAVSRFKTIQQKAAAIKIATPD